MKRLIVGIVAGGLIMSGVVGCGPDPVEKMPSEQQDNEGSPVEFPKEEFEPRDPNEIETEPPADTEVEEFEFEDYDEETGDTNSGMEEESG